MKRLIINPAKKISRIISVSGDKSISHRAVMIGALAKGETMVDNFLMGADCLATINCFRKMGIQVQIINDQLTINNECKIIIYGKGLFGLKEPEGVLDVGNSGTTIRLMAGILAGQDFVSQITGDESIRRRPMRRIALPLRMMGADIEGQGQEEVFVPLKINGGDLKPITYEPPMASAQVKSAILLAGLFAKGETAVVEKSLSRDHTERMLGHFGAEIFVQGLTSSIQGQDEFEGTEVDVPGDISSAAFFLVAGLIAPKSELKITNVGVNPTRTGIVEVLHRMGANIEIQNERILSEEPRADILVKSSGLKGIIIGGEVIPRIIDEIPIVAVAATQAEGVTEIRGAKELRFKESDRLKTTTSELRKMGASIEELEDGLKITGPTKLHGAKVNSYGDHRIAMSAAIAGLIAEGETVIENTDCIETSFPGFARLISRLTQ